MTAANSIKTQQKALDDTILLNSLEGVGGTGRIKAASGYFQWRDEIFIKKDWQYRYFFKHDVLWARCRDCSIFNSIATPSKSSDSAPFLATIDKSIDVGKKS